MKKLILVAAVLAFACSKQKPDAKPSDKPSANAPAPGKGPAATAAPSGGGKVKSLADLSKLAIDKKGWDDPEWNDGTKDWKLDKETPKGDDTNDISTFFITTIDEGAPGGMDDYATKLQVKDFQDMDFRYTAIASKTPLPNGGWVIKGTVMSDPPMADDKPGPGFVALVDVAGGKVLCKSETMVNDKLVDEAIEICKNLKLK